MPGEMRFSNESAQSPAAEQPKQEVPVLIRQWFSDYSPEYADFLEIMNNTNAFSIDAFDAYKLSSEDPSVIKHEKEVFAILAEYRAARDIVDIKERRQAKKKLAEVFVKKIRVIFDEKTG